MASSTSRQGGALDSAAAVRSDRMEALVSELTAEARLRGGGHAWVDRPALTSKLARAACGAGMDRIAAAAA
jgi:hypothetical protein